MPLLTDGSQARKTEDDKEMMLARVERNGGPTYLMASLLQMSKFGGTGAQATKDTIDSVFRRWHTKINRLCALIDWING